VQRQLTAGSLSVQLAGADLWRVRIRGREVARRLYVAVREPDWGTVPPVIDDVTVSEDEQGFAIRASLLHERGQIALRSTIEIDGRADGTLRYAMDGVALREFAAGRIGICVHHPPETCAGNAYQIDGPGGPRRGRFPQTVLPQAIEDGRDWPPLAQIERITITQADGAGIALAFDGALFSLEDQRNFGDATYKSCTQDPVEFPPRFRSGEAVRQSVGITLAGGATQPYGEGVVRIGSRSQPRVLVELGFSYDPAHRLGEAGSALLEAVRPDYLRAACRSAADVHSAAGAGLPLELELHAARASDEVVAAASALPREAVRRVLVRDPANPVPAAHLVAEVRAAMGGGRSVGLSAAVLSDLTAYRPDVSGADALGWEIQPQVHADDDRSLMENCTSHGAMVAAAAEIGRGCVTCPAISLAAPGAGDRRVDDDLAGAWVSGSLAALAECTPDAVAMLFANGPDAPALESPAVQALRLVARLRGAELRATASSDPATAVCFTFANSGSGAVVVNLTPEAVDVELGEAGTRHALEPYQVLTTRWP
jgi:hypothetical protein